MQSKFRSAVWFTGVSLAAIGAITPALAQETTRVTDEIVVTAEKREASVQDVPIAVSAFDESKLDRMQINDGQDLALAIPNFQFSKQNFTGTNIAIRGIGSKLVATSGDPAVGIHINGAPLTVSRIFETEFYDVERVEVLRGPQGTLYGRNASAGVLNIITAKPQIGEWGGAIEGTYGNFSTQKLRGSLNVPLGESVALRIAGFGTKRDGFTDNVTTGHDIDDRNMYSLRATLGIELSERDHFYFMASVFDEDSSRSRIGKQLCVPDTRPWPYSQGCLPTGLGFAAPTSHSTLGGVFTFLPVIITAVPDGLELYPLGTATTGVAPQDFRTQAAPFDPTHQAHEEYYQMEYSHDWDFGTFTSLTSYQRDFVRSSVDYSQSEALTPFLAGPLAPGGVFTDPFTGSATSLRQYDISDAKSEQITQELRFVSDLEGPFNFTVGGIYIDFNSAGTYKVIANSLSFNGMIFGVPQDLWFYNNNTPDYTLQASALFGEGYYNFTDDFKFTLGLRYTSDDKSVTARQTLLTTNPPFETRKASFEEVTGRVGFDWSTALPFTEESNFYAFYSKGYKGGGVNPPFDPALFPDTAVDFAPEFINAFELGVKNTLNDGRLTANFSAFHYDYEGYQVSKIVNRTSVNENIDAKVMGVEGEFTWEPVNGLVFDANVAWLDSEIGDSTSVNTIDPTLGNPAFTMVKVVPSSSNCIVDTAALAVLTGMFTANAVEPGDFGLDAGLSDPQAAGAVACTVLDPDNAVGPIAGIQAFIEGTLTRDIFAASGSDGLPQDVSGNKLPNSPEWQVSFGAQWTFPVSAGWAITPRVDYFWQAESYARIFNGPTDELDAYDQINASLRLDNEAGFYVNVFVKNATDEEVVTDLYLTDQSSGLFSNAFLLEPRTYGVTVGKTW